MKRFVAFLLITTALILCLPSCSSQKKAKESFCMGFAAKALEYEDMSEYYIAGYKGGRNPRGVLDPQQVKAAWIDNGAVSVLLITVDCVALDGETIEKIRTELHDFVLDTGCASVNVISTHTHAGVDTLGLWGDVGINGKNEEFINQIISTSAQVARNAYEDRCEGKLLFSATETEGLQEDSRAPYVYDNNLYQLRFEPFDSTKSGIRLVSFAAHAEALRGSNLMISADFPGRLAKLVEDACKDRLMFFPGAIGGLIMTPELASNALDSMYLTAERLAAYVLSPEGERELSSEIKISRVEFNTKLDNTLFIYYKFLGILGNDVRRGLFGGYKLSTELTLLSLGDVTLSLLPGEVFPELVYGEGRLCDIAKDYGIDTLVPIGLANDEIGYIIPENDFILSSDAPYVKEAEEHYEETNSVGPNCAADLTVAFKRAAKKLK